MEVIDPFVPSYQSDEGFKVEIPEDWVTPFSAEEPALDSQAPTETFDAALSTLVEPSVEMDTFTVAEPVTLAPGEAPIAFEDTSPDSGLDQAHDLSRQLDETVTRLQEALESTSTQHASRQEERAQMLDRIRYLEGEAAKKDRFKEAMLSGVGAGISSDDIANLQSMTDSLVQDPDRLTCLFNVVQQAAQLSSVVTVFNQARRLAEEL